MEGTHFYHCDVIPVEKTTVERRRAGRAGNRGFGGCGARTNLCADLVDSSRYVSSQAGTSTWSWLRARERSARVRCVNTVVRNAAKGVGPRCGQVRRTRLMRRARMPGAAQLSTARGASRSPPPSQASQAASFIFTLL
jgi:hypothetical protein